MVDVGEAAVEGLDVRHQGCRWNVGCVGGIERIDIRLAAVEVFGVGVPRGLRHVVVGLGPGVVGQQLEAVRHPFSQSGLERVIACRSNHGGVDDVGVVFVAACDCDTRADGGSRVIDPSGGGAGCAGREAQNGGRRGACVRCCVYGGVNI